MNGTYETASGLMESNSAKIEYCITVINKSDCHIGNYTAYGIAAKADCGLERSLFDDISADREIAQRFVNICNIYAVSELHVFDVLYDFLIS